MSGAESTESTGEKTTSCHDDGEQKLDAKPMRRGRSFQRKDQI